MTATLRRIDQATLILAPVATGQVMTHAGLENGALFIGAWNLASVAVEYYLMWKVYATVPALAYKQLNSEEEVETEGTEKEETTSPRGPDDTEVFLSRDEEDTQILLEQNGHLHSNHKKDQRDTRCFSCYHCCFLRVFGQITTVYEGWKSFMSYSVSLAGLALSCLFMTVLGFDNITIAYAVTQNLSEAVCGILMAVSAVFGMVGTFVYPVLRQRVGLIRTGMLALSCQVTCLSMCVASIWMPGSPFDPSYSEAGSDGDDGVLLNVTANVGFSLQNLTSAPGSNHTSALQPGADGNSESKSYESVGFLMTGIILSRFGLYMADLSIIQLFLEAIVEKERGVVNGVQNSLNKFMEVLKFLLVVFVPDTQTFGFLIIVSFSFILAAWVLYAIFYRRENGRFVQCPQGGSTARYGQLDSSLEE